MKTFCMQCHMPSADECRENGAVNIILCREHAGLVYEGLARRYRSFLARLEREVGIPPYSQLDERFRESDVLLRIQEMREAAEQKKSGET